MMTTSSIDVARLSCQRSAMANALAVRSFVEMPPREPADTSPISLRIPNAWFAELDELGVRMSRPGIELGRSDVIRAAIARGIQELMTETQPETRDRKSEPKPREPKPRKR